MIVVVAMAGRGSRMAERGGGRPKPLIDIAGRPMVAWACRSLAGLRDNRIVFVALKEHDEEYNLLPILREIHKDAQLVLLDDVTEGQLCTVLTAKEHFRPDEGVLICPSDTYVVSNIHEDIAKADPTCRGIISVTQAEGDRWSFAKLNDRGAVSEVAEKRRISNHASTGLYYFAKASDLIDVGEAMIAADARVRGEFYVIPVYQRMIERGDRVEISRAAAMWDMGSPDALDRFETALGTQDLPL